MVIFVYHLKTTTNMNKMKTKTFEIDPAFEPSFDNLALLEIAITNLQNEKDKLQLIENWTWTEHNFNDTLNAKLFELVGRKTIMQFTLTVLNKNKM